MVMRRGADHYIFISSIESEDKMGNTPSLHIQIIPMLFKDHLDDLGISIRSLGDPKSENYIGVSSRTIQRGLKDGYFTRKTIEALADIMDTDHFVIEVDYDDLEILTKENAELKREIDKLKIENDYLKDRLIFLKSTIQDALKSL